MLRAQGQTLPRHRRAVKTGAQLGPQKYSKAASAVTEITRWRPHEYPAQQV